MYNKYKFETTRFELYYGVDIKVNYSCFVIEQIESKFDIDVIENDFFSFCVQIYNYYLADEKF